MKKNNSPVVSVLCLTYNQKKYVKQMIDSVLSQITDFKVEILVNDDASDDGTVDILRKYQSEYKDKIHLNVQKENQYSQGKRNFFSRYLLAKAKGKYLAICEGDDYWTDPHKLQKQVDYMEAHTDVALSFHPVRVMFEGVAREEYVFPERTNGFSRKELIKGNFIQTNSVMYRTQQYGDLNNEVMPGDWYLHLYHAQFGKIGFINQTMAVYRRHDKGTWWSSVKDSDTIWRKHSVGFLNLYIEMLRMYGDNHALRPIIDRYIEDLIERLIKLDNKYGDDSIKTIAELKPDLIQQVITVLSKQLSNERLIHQKTNDHLGNISKILTTEQKEKARLQRSIYRRLRSKVGKIVRQK